MTYQTTITRKGQMTIPKNIREILNLPLGRKVIIELDRKKKTLMFKTLPTFEKLAGSFKVKNPKDPVKIREYMEKHYQRI